MRLRCKSWAVFTEYPFFNIRYYYFITKIDSIAIDSLWFVSGVYLSEDGITLDSLAEKIYTYIPPPDSVSWKYLDRVQGSLLGGALFNYEEVKTQLKYFFSLRIK